MNIIDNIRKENESFVKNSNFKGTKNLIVDNYNDSVHFVFEILQNADDAQATEIEFDLSDDMLEITHNGIPFSENDVKSICSISMGTKREDCTKIGRFGIGFKSVFSYTAKPEVHSGCYDFLIEELILPRNIEHIDLRLGTVFRLPLDASKNVSAIHNDIKFKLLSGSYEMLLFLTHLKKITIIADDKTRIINKKVFDKNKVKSSTTYQMTRIRIVQKDKNSFETNDYYFLLFRKDKISVTDKDKDGNVEKIDNQSVMIAYSLKEDLSNVDDDEDTHLERRSIYRMKFTLDKVSRNNYFVFFPTAIRNEYPFFIHAPFITKFSRDTFAENNSVNKKLMTMIGRLIADSLLILTKKGYFDNKDTHTRSFSTFLRYDIYDEYFFRIGLEPTIYNAFTNEFENLVQTYNLIPAFDNKYVSLNKAIFTSLNEEEAKLVKTLFGKEWFNECFHCEDGFKLCPIVHNHSQFKEFIEELTDKDILDKRFILENISEDYLKEQDNKWFKKFIQIFIKKKHNFYEGTSLEITDDVGDIRPFPLVKLANGDFINYETLQKRDDIFINNHSLDESLFNEPINDSTYYLEAINDPIYYLYSNVFSIKKFSPDLAGAMKAIRMIETHHDLSIHAYCQYLSMIVHAVKDNLIDKHELENRPIIKIRNLKTHDVDFVIPAQATIGHFNKGNINLYEMYADSNVSLVVEEAYKNGLNDNDFILLGCNSDFKIGRITEWVFFQKNDSIVNSHHIPKYNLYLKTFKSKASNRSFNPLFSLPNVENALSTHMTLNKSINIMKTADFFCDEIRDYVQYSSRQNFDENASYQGDFMGYTSFGIALISNSWIYNKNNSLCRPSQLSIDDLHPEYDRIINKKLAKVLGLQQSANDAIKKAEADLKSKGIEGHFIAEEDFRLLQEIKSQKRAEEEKRKKQEQISAAEALNKVNKTHAAPKDRAQDYPDEYNSIHNAKRRGEKLETELKNNDLKIKERRISAKRDVNDAERAFLKMEYHGKCQICGERIISKKGQPIFMATNLIKVSKLDDEGKKANDLAWNSLCLCPNCSHKLRFCNNDFTGLVDRIKETDIQENDQDEYLFDIKLDNQDAMIEYSPKHLQNVQIAIKYYERQKKQDLEKIMEDDING